jgi:hypothetical protein
MAIPLRRGFDLGLRLHRLRSFAGDVVRLADDLRKCVLFIGHLSGDKTDFQSFGSAFLLEYEGHGYLVTAGHIAKDLGDMPVQIRANLTDGSAVIMVCDPEMDPTSPRWFASDDPAVDLAVMPFHADISRFGLDIIYLNAESWAFKEDDRQGIGCGDFCYAVGLFRLMQGNRRNLPIVHTGHIAMMPSKADPIPVTDRRTGIVTYVEGYLAQMTNLDGLSGSPVFVRSEATYDSSPFPGGPPDAALPRALVSLLGIWQASWEGEPLPHLQKRLYERVPVGMGVVVPAERLRDLLDRSDLKAQRTEREVQMRNATADTPR